MFSTNFENFLIFTSNSKLSSADCFNLEQSKILLSGNGLTLHYNLFLLFRFVHFESICRCGSVTGFNPFSNGIFFNSSQTKEFADDIFKFDENG